MGIWHTIKYFMNKICLKLKVTIIYMNTPYLSRKCLSKRKHIQACNGIYSTLLYITINSKTGSLNSGT